jgi:hypothetical protein
VGGHIEQEAFVGVAPERHPAGSLNGFDALSLPRYWFFTPRLRFNTYKTAGNAAEKINPLLPIALLNRHEIISAESGEMALHFVLEQAFFGFHAADFKVNASTKALAAS